MVSSFTNTFIFIVLLFVGSPSASAQSEVRASIGGLSYPSYLRLKSSDAREASLYSVRSGAQVGIEWERRWGRWSVGMGAGLASLSSKVSAEAGDITYSYGGTPSLQYQIGLLGRYWIDRDVKVGLGLRSNYAALAYPLPSSPGITYRFEYGSAFHHFLSFEMEWRLSQKWFLLQSILAPLQSEVRTGWSVLIGRRF